MIKSFSEGCHEIDMEWSTRELGVKLRCVEMEDGGVNLLGVVLL